MKSDYFHISEDKEVSYLYKSTLHVLSVNMCYVLDLEVIQMFQVFRCEAFARLMDHGNAIHDSRIQPLMNS